MKDELVKRLEDEFFLKQDRELIKKHQEMLKLRQTKEALAEASGIHDDMVLTKLVELNIRPESVASLALVPLVLAAWADGKVDAREKASILSAVEKSGWAKDGWDYSLLDRWLEHNPPVTMIEAWMHYVGSLCKKMNAEEIKHFKNEIMSHTKAVAEASGGLLGLGKISEQEDKLLKKLESAFDVCSI